ncbi:MAG: hypothetical protein E7543_02855 [Ruminococcaceae bacterium]|nr:hypothetical protein [Oscillospiraceae bacterium]
MTKYKAMLEKHYYSVFFFLFLLIYSCAVPGELKPWEIYGVTQSFHAVDYSMGFCSRFLPGAIYSFFFDSYDEQLMNIYLSVLMIVFFFILSIFLEKFMLNVASEYRLIALVILLFFITGPATFSIYIKVLGMFDVYWVFSALLFFILLSKKETWFLLFIPFLICVLTYYVTWLCYIPLYIIIVLYKISVTEKKNDRAYLWSSLVFSVIASVALTIYFVLFEKENLTYSADEFVNVLNSRGDIYTGYYEECLYYHYNDMVLTGNIFEEFMFRLSINFDYFNMFLPIPLYLLLAPVVVLVYRFFFKQISICGSKMKKFSYVCMLLLFAGTLVSTFFMSMDFVRWAGHAFLPLFTGFVYVLHNEGSAAWETVKEFFEKYPLRNIIVFLIFYAAVVYDPYLV